MYFSYLREFYHQAGHRLQLENIDQENFIWPVTFDFWPGWSFDWLAPAAVAATTTEISHCKVSVFYFFPLCLWPPDLLSSCFMFCCRCSTFFKKVCVHFPSPVQPRTPKESHFALVWPHIQTLFLQVCPTCLSVGIITGNWDGGMWGKRRTHRKQLPMFPPLQWLQHQRWCSLMAVSHQPLWPAGGTKVSDRSALRTAAVQIK